MKDLSKEELQQEKELILKKLIDRAEFSPKLEEKIKAKFEDLGDEVDDSVHEVEQMEVETTVVSLLFRRLEEINEELEQRKEN
ncbi:MAG: hypothetical protein BRC22_02950 [Parcubacteria group bacterium QH_9_35_7]|nr:MAG: hypothetical protein BRC22_02950 [Parcubacteria group bacterium QH_9_35_7]